MKSTFWKKFLVMLLAATLIQSGSVAFAQAEDDEYAGFEEPAETGSPVRTEPIDYTDDSGVEFAGVKYILSRSRDQVEIPEGIPESHTVVRGDTLWGISGMYLRDNYLWPLIWELNIDRIPNPHLIFPGQIVYLPNPAMFGTGGMEPDPFLTDDDGDDDNLGEVLEPVTETADAEGDGTADVDRFIEPVLTSKEMEAIGYIVPDRTPCQFEIIGAELYQEFMLAKGDLIYVNTGSVDDAKPGDKFFAFSYQRRVKHPVTGKNVGWFVNNLGIIELVCVFENTSLAIIKESWEPINIGDCIGPYAQIPSPWLQDTGLTKCSLPTKDRTGYVIEAKLNFTGDTENVFSAEGDIVYIDLGFEDNVSNGDYFMIYLSRPEGSPIPELPIGELIVLRATERFATCFITKALYEIELGHAVDYLQFTQTDLEMVDDVQLFGGGGDADARKKQGAIY